MEVIIRETGKHQTLSLIDPRTGLEGFSGFIERCTGLPDNKSHTMPHANFHYWRGMLSKEQEGIDFIHQTNQGKDNAIHSLIISDLRAAANYSPIDTINAQAAIIKRLKLGKIIEQKNPDGSSSIDVFSIEKTISGHAASVKGNFTVTMPCLNDNINFTATLNILYEYHGVDRCVCVEDYDLPMGFSENQEADLLYLLHTALKEAFVRRGIANCFYVNKIA